MANSKKTILQYTKPEIVLDEMATSSGSSDGKGNPLGADLRPKFYGQQLPFIRINAYEVKNLRYFKLDLEGPIPTVIFRFNTTDEIFLFASYPKDGDPVSVFIKSTSSVYKPIRIDFTIKRVIGPLSGYSTIDPSKRSKGSGEFNSFTITAEMRIPGLYKDRIKMFSKKSSWEALMEISKELKLGFSSNEKNTQDSMNWLCPSIGYDSAINDISNHSWLGEEDFFDWWIDPYYNLTFVNWRKQFYEPDEDFEMVKMALGPDQHGGFLLDGSIKDMEHEIPLMLTNDYEYSQTPVYIESFSVEHASGTIGDETGYFRNLQFYDSDLVNDKPKNKFVSYKIESVTSKALKEKEITQKGRIGEDHYKDDVRDHYIGTCYFDNVHKNYHQSYYQNVLNRMENYKTVLKVETKTFLPFIYKGQNIPVNIIHANSVHTNELKSVDGNPSKDAMRTNIPNRFLSGRYVVLGSTVEWKDGRIKQIFTLGKREWALNAGDSSNPGPDIKVT